MQRLRYHERAPHNSSHRSGAITGPTCSVGPVVCCGAMKGSRATVAYFPCSACGQRFPGKFASAYWAWYVDQNRRVAWKQRLCPNCVGAELVELIQCVLAADYDGHSCAACHASVNGDSDVTFLKLYVPGQEEMDLSFPADNACAARLRIAAERGGERLPDREPQVRGPSPSPTSAWDAIGLKPQ
jgi:hypothetical protein